MIPSGLVEMLARSGAPLAVSHVNPDGDAVGSLLGVGWMMRALGKRPTLALQDPTPPEFGSLPGIAEIVDERSVGDAYDLVICVDASSADRMGRVYTAALADAPLIVIDHHVTNTRFGSINWVDPQAAATCQMLVELADALGAPLQSPLAQCLLAGLVTDTLCFRTPNTTPAVLETAMRLMRAGADLAAISEDMLDRRTFGALRLWGAVLDDVTMEQGVVWAGVSRQQLADADARQGDDGSLSSLLIRTVGANISASFVEKTDHDGAPAVECSFRARRGFDVSSVALALGGGGHPGAAGCTVSGSLAAVIARVTPMLQTVSQDRATEK